MKSNSLTVTVPQSREFATPKISNPFTWKNAAMLYSRVLPSFFEFGQVTIQDAKFITGAVLFSSFIGCVIFFVVPFLLYIFG